MPNQHDRVTHHVVQHAAALQVTAPEPRLVRAAVLLGRARQIRAAREGNTSRPNNVAASRNGWREKLVLQISMAESDSINQLDDPFCFSDIPRKGFLAGDALKRTASTFDRGYDLFDVFDPRMVGSAKPDRSDTGIRNHVADRAVDLRLADLQ